VIDEQMQKRMDDLHGERKMMLHHAPVPLSPFSPATLKSRSVSAGSTPGSGRFDLSDGEMTDATDITLDGMVRENELRNLISSPETVSFSDYENMSEDRSSSSSDSQKDYDVDGKEKKKSAARAGKKTIVKQINQSQHRTQVQLGHNSQSESSTQVVESYRKETSHEVRQENRERKRSIKDLVKSFEGHAPSFLQGKPKSVEDLRRTPSEQSLESYDDDNLPTAEMLRTSMRELSGSEPNLSQGPPHEQDLQPQCQPRGQGRIQGRRGGLRKK